MAQDAVEALKEPACQAILTHLVEAASGATLCILVPPPGRERFSQLW